MDEHRRKLERDARMDGASRERLDREQCRLGVHDWTLRHEITHTFPAHGGTQVHVCVEGTCARCSKIDTGNPGPGIVPWIVQRVTELCAKEFTAPFKLRSHKEEVTVFSAAGAPWEIIFHAIVQFTNAKGATQPADTPAIMYDLDEDFLEPIEDSDGFSPYD